MKKKNVTDARAIAMYLSRIMTEESLQRIGLEFGGRDHSTVIHAVDKISQDIVEEHLPELKKRLENQGYTVQLTTEIIENGEQISPFQQILEADRPRSEVKRYGFDIRL